MEEENNIPPIEDITNNLEEYFDLPKEGLEDDLEIYNPQRFFTYSELLKAGKEIYESKDYGTALYYFSLILKKDFDDYFFNEFHNPDIKEPITHPSKQEAYHFLIFTTVAINSDLRERLDIKPSFKFPTREEQEEFLRLIKEYSPHYDKYKRLKEKFGTDFEPLIDDFNF